MRIVKMAILFSILSWLLLRAFTNLVEFDDDESHVEVSVSITPSINSGHTWCGSERYKKSLFSFNLEFFGSFLGMIVYVILYYGVYSNFYMLLTLIFTFLFVQLIEYRSRENPELNQLDQKTSEIKGPRIE